MTIPKEILDAYEKYAKKYGVSQPGFPYSTTPDLGGACIWKSNQMAEW